MATLTPQQEIINRRLPLVTSGLVLMSVLLLLAMARLQQLSPSVRQEFEIRGSYNTQSVKRLQAVRGVIYDRDGVPLAFNRLQYEIGVSPNLVSDPTRVAQQLGVILNLDEFAILQRISNTDSQWELIARGVSADVGQAVADEDLLGVVINPMLSRAYPQGVLGSQLIGFIYGDNDNTRGAMGIEASYNEQLAGRSLERTVSTVPIDTPVDIDSQGQRGMDIVLTIDRDIQYWVELELQRAIEQENASGGTIIVMNPRNGEILAMATYPTFDPNNFGAVEDASLLDTPSISEVYEPGSVMKVMTVAAALDVGVITPEWTYNDTGSITVGSVTTENWDRNAYGVVDTTGLLVNSLNVGAATVSTTMGPEAFYSGLRRFGIGRQTGVDLEGEEQGIMRVPGDTGWSESDLASNSYGQAISVTPLQMITAFSAIANDGLMYQPHLARQYVNGDEIEFVNPTVLGRAISAETADIMTDILVQVIAQGDSAAAIPGYTIAGKTGTAEIASPLGYEEGNNSTIASFIGFFPADDPQVVVLVKLDRPDGYWGSRTAAPVFRTVAQRLILLLGIPTDEVRQSLEQQGGVLNQP